MHEILHVLIHTIKHSLNILPFLFVAFFIIELIEHKFSKKTQEIITKSGKLGPLVGSLLGAVPQCGFSVIATNLYTTRIVSLGTLISIYLATSDEMLPILISRNVDIKIILLILGIKVGIGMFCGFIIDFIIRNKEKADFKLCEDDHCDCEESLLKSSIIHTLKTFIFILIITFILNLLFEYIPQSIIEKIFFSNSIFAPVLTSLFGLVPNCAASVMITELYLNGIITLGTAIGGLLTGSGVALAVLVKNNENKKETFAILATIYVIGVVSGIILNMVGV